MISYIIPAHNCEKTIDRAVKSIKKYNTDYEIIIIENGSTDNTKKKLLRLQDTNVKVYFNKKNGVSSARNLGIEKASGEWICFVDADDYIISCPKLKEINDVDLIMFNYQVGNNNRNLYSNIYLMSKELNKEIINFISNPTKYMQVWSKLFSIKIIRDNSLYFDTSLEVAEDSDYFFRYVKCCDRIYESSQLLYHYSIDNISTIRSADIDISNKYISAMQKMCQYKLDNKELNSAINKYILIHQTISLVRGIFSQTNLSFKEKCLKANRIRKDQIYKDALNNQKISSLFKVRLLPQLFIKSHMNLLANILCDLRAKRNTSKIKK